MRNSITSTFVVFLTAITVVCGVQSSHAGDIDPSGFSLFSGGEFYVLTDGVFGSDENIEVRFESNSASTLKEYGGIDLRVYRVAKPLDFLRAQKNLHRPSVKPGTQGEGLANVLSYLWDTWYKKARLAWQRVFSPESRKAAVQAVPQLVQKPAHTYKTEFRHETQFAPIKGMQVVESIRYPIWQAKTYEPHKDTSMQGSSHDFIRTPEGNVILPLGKRKPGLYLIEAMIGSYRATTLAFVSDSIIVSKVSSDQAFVWTAHRRTGLARPESKVVLTDGTGILDQGVAAADGTYITKRAIPERTFAMVEDKDGGVSISENFFYDSESYQPKVYLFTDRPLYQPGDEVTVRAFGRDLKRQGANDVWSVLTGAGASLTVVDATGVTLFSETAKWEGANGAEMKFRLPATSENGGYRLRFRLDNEEYGAAFRVGRFTKPHFDAQIVFDKPAYRVGEAVKGRLVLTYPSGQPVVDADVDLSLRSEQMSMFEGSYTYMNASEVSLTAATLKTDKTGQAVFSFPAATKPSRYIASARSMDQGAFRVSTKKEILIEGYLETYILTSEFNATPMGAPVKIKFDRQGNDAADFTQPLTQWQAIRLEDRSVFTGPVKAVDAGEFEMKLERSGHYVVRVVDGSGVTRGTRSHVVLGPDLKSVTGQLEILGNREAYVIGDTAELLLTFPFKADDALLTLERNNVSAHGRLGGKADWYSAKRVSDTQWKVEVPIQDSHSPNIVFSVAYTKNGDFGFQNKGLIVKKPMIDITFRADKAVYSPGDKVVVNVETKLDGKPLAALMAVGVVDEMIYVLQPEIAPPIGEFFHHQRRNQVRTTSSLSFYSFNPATSSLDASSRSTSTANRDLKVLQERARRDARDTAYWNGSLKTGSDGKARFEFVMPDALTRWRITGRAIAISASSGTSGLGSVGESKSFVLSDKSQYLKWTGPTRFRQGDVPRPAMIAFNSGKSAVNADVFLKGPKYSFSQKVAMKPGANTIVLDKPIDQSQVLTASISIDGKSVDALQLPVDFVSDTWMQRQSRLIRLEKKEKLALPTTAKNIRVKIVSDATHQFLRIADDLLEYPWGCVEQTASRLIPLTMAVNALSAVEAGNPAIPSMRDRVASERRRLVSLAGRGAEFTWWGDQTSGSLLLTSHAYHADWRASQLLEISIDKESWEHLLKIYAEAKNENYLTRAYALWVISKLGLPVGEQVQSLGKELFGDPKVATAKAKSGPVSASIFMDSSDDTVFAAFVLGSIAARKGIAFPPAWQNQLRTFAGAVAQSAAAGGGQSMTSVATQAAMLSYRAASKQPGDRLAEATNILDSIRIESPTIDRALALAFVEESLPQMFELKNQGKQVDLGTGWKRDVKGTIPTFVWNDATGFNSSVNLPVLSGAVAEVAYDNKEEPKSTMPFKIERTLYKVSFSDSGDGTDTLNAVALVPNEPIDSRSLYVDEITVTPAGGVGRYMLLEVPLPPGGETDASTWGLSFSGLSPNFVQARSAAQGLGYAVPIEEVKQATTYHQLVRFASRGKFVLPPVKLFKMYRPTDRAYQTDRNLSVLNVN